MNLDMAGVDHQPFIIRFSYQLFQQRFPNALVPPAAKPAVRVFPVAVVGRQVTPGRARAQNPENRVDKQPVVLRRAAPGAFAPGQAGSHQLPNPVRYVVSAVRWLCHAFPFRIIKIGQLSHNSVNL